jgi:hypothetical protein
MSDIRFNNKLRITAGARMRGFVYRRVKTLGQLKFCVNPKFCVN